MRKQVSFSQFCLSLFNLFIPLVGIVLYFKYNDPLFLFAITVGDATAPANILTYLDAVFTSSLPNYKKKLVDNIGESNAFFHKLIKSESYESYDGGTDIRENLLYELAVGDWYDGYEELPDGPIDGITQSVFQASQMAIPIQYSMKEVINNKQKLFDLVKAKMTQSEMGAQETFAQALMWGAGAGALETPRTGSSGASAIQPLWSLIRKDPTTSTVIGNINQSSETWWRNKTKDSAATTYDAFILEGLNVFNNCARGTGGPPDLVLTDQTTYELWSFALYQRYRNVNSDVDYPFTNIKLPFGNGRTLMVMDDKVPDLQNGTLPADSVLTKGTEAWLNSKFFRLRYIPERDFEMLTDENGKSFAKPLKGDSRLGHIGWMGSPTICNRRKHAIRFDIARTLTVS